ncbi:MAG: hypothetical protein WCF30_18075 [Terracidiphilus sp.]
MEGEALLQYCEALLQGPQNSLANLAQQNRAPQRRSSVIGARVLEMDGFAQRTALQDRPKCQTLVAGRHSKVVLSAHYSPFWEF